MTIVGEILAIVAATATIVKYLAPLANSVLKERAAKAQTEADRVRLTRGIEAINYAEEWATTLRKVNPEAKVNGDKKLDEAFDYYMRVLPNEDRDVAKKFLRGLLTPIEGMGATGAAKGSLPVL